jgi:hypothetical protein
MPGVFTKLISITQPHRGEGIHTRPAKIVTPSPSPHARAPLPPPPAARPSTCARPGGSEDTGYSTTSIVKCLQFGRALKARLSQ